MDEKKQAELPPVELYAILPGQAERMAPLLTREAADMIRSGEAVGLAIAEEGELRGAICGRQTPENELVLELLSLYVAPAWRRRGLGGTLLMEYLESAMASADGMFTLVTAEFLPDEGLSALLEQAGFVMEETEGHSCILTVEQLRETPLARTPARLPVGCLLVPLSDVPASRLMGTMEQAGGDFIDLSRLREAVPEYSFVLLNTEGEPVACSVLTGGAEDRLCLAQFFTQGGSPGESLAVLGASARAIAEHSPGEREVEIPILARSGGKLADRLLGGAGEKRPLIRAVLEL